MNILLLTSKIGLGAYDAPPLGLYRIKAFIETQTVHKVQIFDFCLNTDKYLKKLLAKAQQNYYQIIGFSVTHHQMAEDIELINLFKQAVGDKTLLIAGGQEASLNYKQWLKTPLDMILLGFAEKTFLQIVKIIEDDKKIKSSKLLKKIENVDGIVFRKNKQIKVNPAKPIYYEDFIFLGYELAKKMTIPFSRYWRKTKKNLKRFNIGKTIFVAENIRLVTSSHCPYKCGFCASSEFFSSGIYADNIKPMRLTSSQVFDLIMFYCKRYGAKSFLFNDDEFTLDKRRINDLCDMIIKAKQNAQLDEKLIFNCQSRVTDFYDKNGLDYLFVKNLKHAGFHSIGMGIETFSDRLLKQPSLNKLNYNSHKSFEVITSLLKADIIPHIFIILFIPEAEKEDITETIDKTLMLVEQGVEIVVNPYMIALPGSALDNNALYKTKTKNICASLQTNKHIKVKQYFIPLSKDLKQTFERFDVVANAKIDNYKKHTNNKKIPKTILGLLYFEAFCELIDDKQLLSKCQFMTQKLTFK